MSSGKQPLRQLARERLGDEFRIGLCLPMRGAAGIWGPSCLASARLAESELNRADGIAGKPCALRLVDSSAESAGIEENLIDLVQAGQVDALVGMCISSVRQRIVDAVGGQIPFVYTCLYEGGESTPGLFAIGETALRQLAPSIAWLSVQRGPRRWLLVGNNYVWPRVSHRIARQCIADCGGEVVGQAYLSFGVTDYSAVLEQIRRSRADAVLISMVGQDAVEFNRAFAAAGLSGRVLRLSCAIEENQLLAIGAANTDNLHVALGYFANLNTEANLSFKERYRQHFGARAPALNSIGQSLYEGLHFLSAMPAGSFAGDPDFGNLGPRSPSRAAHLSARGAAIDGTGSYGAPIYLAQADGHQFRVIEQL